MLLPSLALRRRRGQPPSLPHTLALALPHPCPHPVILPQGAAPILGSAQAQGPAPLPSSYSSPRLPHPCPHPVILPQGAAPALGSAQVQGQPPARQLQFEDLSTFPYFNSVLKEAIRMHPPATGVFRCVRACVFTCVCACCVHLLVLLCVCVCIVSFCVRPCACACCLLVLVYMCTCVRTYLCACVCMHACVCVCACTCACVRMRHPLPARPWACRRASEDLEVGGYFIPKGAQVGLWGLPPLEVVRS